MGAGSLELPVQENELLPSCVGQFLVVCSVCCWDCWLILRAWPKVTTADPVREAPTSVQQSVICSAQVDEFLW